MSDVWDREKVIAKLLECGVPWARPSEEFDGVEGGIWSTGEETLPDGLYLYDSWGDITNGTHPEIKPWLEEAGWFIEPVDPGTLMIWKI
jgi:hypothetical protein